MTKTSSSGVHASHPHLLSLFYVLLWITTTFILIHIQSPVKRENGVISKVGGLDLVFILIVYDWGD